MKITVCRSFLVFLFLTVAGCGPLHLGVKEEQINAEQYHSAQDFLKNQDLATKGISESKLLDILKEQKAHSVTQVNKGDSVQSTLFGNITPHADKNDIADMSSWILSHHIFNLPYKNKRTEFFFDPLPISYNFETFGSDMNLLFITEKDEAKLSSPYILTRIIVTGTQNERTKTREYIWSGIATAIIEAGKKLLF